MCKLIEIEKTESTGFILTFNGKYWGKEWIEYGQTSYGIVDDIKNALIFDEKTKPIERARLKSQI